MADLFGDPSLFGEFEKGRRNCNNFEKLKEDRSFLRTTSSSDVPCFHNLKGNLVFGDNLRSSPTTEENDRNGDYIRSLQEEIQKLKDSSEKFQHQDRFHSFGRVESSLSCPVVQILFLDKAFARNYQSRIENYLKILIEEFQEQNEGSTLLLAQNNVQTAGNCHYFKDFILDVTGWPLLECNRLLIDEYSIPRYEQMFRQSLPCENLENSEFSSVKDKSRAKAACFNCGGEHNVTSCPEKKDQQRINTARRQFMDKFPPAVNISGKQRYHIEDDPRFSGMKPGIIGNNLRQALGISSNELPPYIYQMRIVGYPPGHLENAKRHSSGLTMFDKHGLELTSGGELLEDGEVNDEMPNSTVDYNLDKIVEFPGFNVALPPGTVDECESLGMPPMQPQSHKDLMKTRLFAEMIDNCKRKADEIISSNIAKKHQKLNSECETIVDMDIDDTGGPEEQDFQVLPSEHPVSGHFEAAPLPPLPPEQELPPPPPPSLPDTSDAYILSDLSYETEDAMQKESNKFNSKTLMLTHAVTPVHGCFGGSRSFCFGTPVVIPETEPSNSCSSLPDASKFAMGVSELIMHDNLPNATGIFKKLKLVLTELKTQTSPNSCNLK